MKKYEFKKSRGPDDIKIYSKEEDELDEKEIDILLGTLIKYYKDMPKVVRERFKNEYYN